MTAKFKLYCTQFDTPFILLNRYRYGGDRIREGIQWLNISFRSFFLKVRLFHFPSKMIWAPGHTDISSVVLCEYCMLFGHKGSASLGMAGGVSSITQSYPEPQVQNLPCSCSSCAWNSLMPRSVFLSSSASKLLCTNCYHCFPPELGENYNHLDRDSQLMIHTLLAQFKKRLANMTVQTKAEEKLWTENWNARRLCRLQPPALALLRGTVPVSF